MKIHENQSILKIFKNDVFVKDIGVFRHVFFVFVLAMFLLNIITCLPLGLFSGFVMAIFRSIFYAVPFYISFILYVFLIIYRDTYQEYDGLENGIKLSRLKYVFIMSSIFFGILMISFAIHAFIDISNFDLSDILTYAYYVYAFPSIVSFVVFIFYISIKLIFFKRYYNS